MLEIHRMNAIGKFFNNYCLSVEFKAVSKVLIFNQNLPFEYLDGGIFVGFFVWVGFFFLLFFFLRIVCDFLSCRYAYMLQHIVLVFNLWSLLSEGMNCFCYRMIIFLAVYQKWWNLLVSFPVSNLHEEACNKLL